MISQDNAWLIRCSGGNFAPIQVFLTVSTCFLYLVAAGLFSKAVWSLEINKVSDFMAKEESQSADVTIVEQARWW